MNITKILSSSGVHVGWRGNKPTSVDQITDEYLSDDVGGHGPRCVWADGQKPISASQVRAIVAAYKYPPEVTRITKLQLKKELQKRQLWGQLKSKLGSNAEAKEDFELATYLSITDEAVRAFAVAFSYSEDDLSELFKAASESR